MASSLSYGLVGIAALIGFLIGRRRTSSLAVDRTLGTPYICTIIFFPLTIVPALITTSAIVRYAFGLMFLAAFLFYMRIMFRTKKGALVGEVGDCYFHKYAPRILRTPLVAALAQIATAAVILYVGSAAMVTSVISLAEGFNLNPLALALIVVPATTAIPETTSALIWGYRGRDTLSLGSLVGEKVLYSTVYPALGLFLTSWTLDRHAYYSVMATTAVSILLLVFILRRRIPWWGLCLGLFFFAAYATLIFSFRF
jgi:cation:H+ antiporter